MIEFAVCTFGRSQTIAQQTLRTLVDGGVDATQIRLFVANRDEAVAYAKAVPRDMYDSIVVVPYDPSDTSKLGHAAVGHAIPRNAALAQYNAGTAVVFLDDDLDGMFQLSRDHTKLERVSDLCMLFDMAFRCATDLGTKLWGIYPVTNAYFMKPRARCGLVFIIGTVYGVVVNHDDAERTILPVKNDYERSLKAYFNYGAVRLEWLAADTKVYRGNGGCVCVRTPAIAEAAVQYLERTFPGFVHRNPRRKSQFPEILLRDTVTKRRFADYPARHWAVPG